MNDIITFRNLSKYPEIVHGISTKAFGSMKKEDLSIHHANVLKFAKTADINNVVICMDQVHSGKAMLVENDRELVIPQTDGIVTKSTLLALGVTTADCLPILFYDPVTKSVAAAHARSKP
jgi:polyphenol oxidase